MGVINRAITVSPKVKTVLARILRLVTWASLGFLLGLAQVTQCGLAYTDPYIGGSDEKARQSLESRCQ